MGDMLNGRPAEGWEAAAVARGRRCELERDRRLLDGLIAEYPREPDPVRRTTDLTLDPLS